MAWTAKYASRSSVILWGISNRCAPLGTRTTAVRASVNSLRNIISPWSYIRRICVGYSTHLWWPDERSCRAAWQIEGCPPLDEFHSGSDTVLIPDRSPQGCSSTAHDRVIHRHHSRCDGLGCQRL